VDRSSTLAALNGPKRATSANQSHRPVFERREKVSDQSRYQSSKEQASPIKGSIEKERGKIERIAA